MSAAQHASGAGIEISLRLGQRVRHSNDYKGQRVTGTVQSISLDGGVLVVVIALDQPIIIPARGDSREIRLHSQCVPAHEVAPFDEREELLQGLLAALQALHGVFTHMALDEEHQRPTEAEYQAAMATAAALIAEATGSAA